MTLSKVELPAQKFAAYSVSLEYDPLRYEVQGLNTGDAGKVLLGRTPMKSTIIVVATSLESARAALPSGLTRVPTGHPQVEMWV